MHFAVTIFTLPQIQLYFFSDKIDSSINLRYLSKSADRTNKKLTSAAIWILTICVLASVLSTIWSYISVDIYQQTTRDVVFYLWIPCYVVICTLLVFRLYFQLRCLLSVSNKLEVLKSWLLCNNQTRYVPYNTSKDYYRVGAWLELQLVDLQNVFPYLRFIYDEKIRVYVELVFVLFIISLCIIHSRHY